METDFIRKFLVRANEFRDIPSPEVRIEEDGDICFDWLEGGCDLSASVSETGRVAWSAIIKDYRNHGVFQLPEWSDEFDKALSKLHIESI